MRQTLKDLDASYRARAIPAGSARYWSWLFASPESRAALLGIYALLAEWTALMDPATEPSAARIKLAWWQDEMRRLSAGAPVHPIGAYLISLPLAAKVDFAPLQRSVAAAAAEVDGVPLERGTDLPPHAHALRADPLAVASRLAGGVIDEATLSQCTQALAVAEHLSMSLAGYRRAARAGRVPFAVDELMAAGIDNADLAADQPPARLAQYLGLLRERAARRYELAALALPRVQRRQQRHLLVLAALGLKHLQQRAPGHKSRGLQDMLLAWSTAARQ
ncbi:MAG: squalene/phytoene synthase family protein [Steroidobacteraceae bacterium]